MIWFILRFLVVFLEIGKVGDLVDDFVDCYVVDCCGIEFGLEDEDVVGFGELVGVFVKKLISVVFSLSVLIVMSLFKYLVFGFCVSWLM